MPIVNVVLTRLSDGLSTFATFIPKLLGFLIILVIGWIIARALRGAVRFVLGHLHFARLVERAGLAGLLARSQIDLGEVLAQIVYYFVLLIALQYAFAAFGPNPVEALLTEIITFLPLIIVAIVLFVVAAAVARVLRDLVEAALGARPFAHVIGNIVFVFVLALGGIAALNQVGIATTVTTPVLIMVLATIGGVVVVGAGGGLIRPMQGRWERWLDSAERHAGTGPAVAAQPTTPMPAERHAAPTAGE